MQEAVNSSENPGPLGSILAALILTFFHFWVYRFVVSTFLWSLSGGIVTEEMWTHYGAKSWAWATPAEIPGCILSVDCLEDEYPSPCPENGLVRVFSLVLFFGPSIMAGYVLISFAKAIMQKKSPVWGTFGWRLWGILLTWGWIPVPLRWTLVYQFTVLY